MFDPRRGDVALVVDRLSDPSDLFGGQRANFFTELLI